MLLVFVMNLVHYGNQMVNQMDGLFYMLLLFLHFWKPFFSLTRLLSVNVPHTLLIKNQFQQGMVEAGAMHTEDLECTLSKDNIDVSSSLQSMQSFATGAEKNVWRRSGCTVDNVV